MVPGLLRRARERDAPEPSSAPPRTYRTGRGPISGAGVVTRFRILLAVRDPEVAGTLRTWVEGMGAAVLGSIDPAQQGEFLDWPGLADLVLMTASEAIALQRQRRSVLRRLHPEIRLIVVVREEEMIDIAALPQRVNGLIFFAPGVPLTSSQLELALAGYCAFPRDVRRFLAADWRRVVAERLDDRERRVLELLGSGRTNREIAAAMACSETHAKTLVRSVLAKLRIKNRTVAGMIAANILLSDRS